MFLARYEVHATLAVLSPEWPTQADLQEARAVLLRMLPPADAWELVDVRYTHTTPVTENSVVGVELVGIFGVLLHNETRADAEEAADTVMSYCLVPVKKYGGKAEASRVTLEPVYSSKEGNHATD